MLFSSCTYGDVQRYVPIQVVHWKSLMNRLAPYEEKPGYSPEFVGCWDVY
jgi:hypothetical protein